MAKVSSGSWGGGSKAPVYPAGVFIMHSWRQGRTDRRVQWVRRWGRRPPHSQCAQSWTACYYGAEAGLVHSVS